MLFPPKPPNLFRRSFELRLFRIHSLYDCCPRIILSFHCTSVLLFFFFFFFLSRLCPPRLSSVVDIVPAPASFSCTRRVVTLAVFQLPFCCPAPTTKDDCCCCGLLHSFAPRNCSCQRDDSQRQTPSIVDYMLSTPPSGASPTKPLTSIHSCTTLLLLRPCQSGAFVGEPLASPLDSLATDPARHRKNEGSRGAHTDLITA